MSVERQPIETAPKDGRVIWVMHEDVGAFPMAWNAAGTNVLFAPGAMGMWEAPDGSMTWTDQDGCGPSHWAPYDESGAGMAREVRHV